MQNVNECVDAVCKVLDRYGAAITADNEGRIEVTLDRGGWAECDGLDGNGAYDMVVHDALDVWFNSTGKDFVGKSVRVLYNNYVMWMLDRGFRPWGITGFVKTLTARYDLESVPRKYTDENGNRKSYRMVKYKTKHSDQ